MVIAGSKNTFHALTHPHRGRSEERNREQVQTDDVTTTITVMAAHP
jgi:hypothetical protein